MLIERIEAIPIEVPLVKPLKMAVATVERRTCIVVRLTTDDGITGLGSSVVARYFTGESLASAVDLISKPYTEALVGRRVGDLAAHRALMRKISVGNAGARAAVEMALHDAVAKAAGVPLYQWYGGRTRESVPTIWHVSGGTAESKAENAAEAVADGYELIKLKVGRKVDDDIAATFAVREAIGPEVMLLPDANQGWTVADALRYVRAIEETKPGFVEQPVHRDDLMGMATLAKASPVPIAGDEGVFNAADLRTYLAVGACGAVVTKLMKSAGPIGMQQILAVAQAAGIGVHIAGMAGQTSISAAHGAHLAMAAEDLHFGGGISPQYLADDVCTERFLPDKGRLVPSAEPGAGVTIDEDKLTHYRVDK